MSHDRYLINRVATTIGQVGQGRVELHEGDYDAYLESNRALAAAQPTPVDATRSSAGGHRREARRREAQERDRRYRERRNVERKLAPLEAAIEEVEREVRRLESERADPHVYRDPDRARRVAREKSAAESRLNRLYADWEALAGELPDES